MNAPDPNEDRALQYALCVLGYRARSASEMRDRLQRKGFEPAVIETTMASLVRLQLIDDIEFAQAWVAGRRGYGPARLRQELRRKGIERSLAEDVITTGLSEEDEYASARQVAARALRGHALPPERAELLRVRRMLMRRGFSCAVIGRVCASLSPRACEDGDWLE